MAFTSLAYVVFVLAVLLAYTLVPGRFRWGVLLVGSYLFYASLRAPSLLVALFAVTVVSYALGILISRSLNPVTKKFWLCAGVTLNLLLLFWMKYIPFLLENLNRVLRLFSIGDVAAVDVKSYAAIGVSYYVFQGISYLIDVYLEILGPEYHFGYFALYVSFFPRLLQGPIERGGTLLPQIRELSAIRWQDLRAALHLFIWGMFKKVVIADRLASFVDPVYGNVHQHSGVTLFLATYLFAMQLFFDFSGYTDMAMGIARCFNIRLTQNFKAPYLATSISDFWRRWHISFSSWILDYIFKPLQFHFRDWTRWGTPVALIFTFIASGLWHGASWNFIAWGTFHGTCLAGSVLFGKKKLTLYKKLGIANTRVLQIFQRAVTFHLVCFSWIFFRAASLEDACYVSIHAISDLPRSIPLLWGGLRGGADGLFPGKSGNELTVVLLLLMLVVAASGPLSRIGNRDGQDAEPLCWLERFPLWMRGAVYGCLLYLIAFCGASAQSFIYQQF